MCNVTNAGVKALVKSSLSPLAWQGLVTPYRVSNRVLERFRRPYRLWKWKRQLAIRSVDSVQQTQLWPVENRLPNSGGIPLDPTMINPGDVVKIGYSSVEKRQSGVAGFEGLALDDALGWLEEYRHYSFVPLAGAISRIAFDRFGRRSFSVLELGCGWGGLRVLLQSFGSSFYLGIDANPIPFLHSPFMNQSPGSYRLLNLQDTIDFSRTFDITCSFEVLEHIREDRLHSILQTISNHLSENSLFIGTAALTDYTDVHVTVHDRNWWLGKFREHGLGPVAAPQEQKWISMLARNHPFNWTPSTTSIFVLERI